MRTVDMSLIVGQPEIAVPAIAGGYNVDKHPSSLHRGGPNEGDHYICPAI
jgi:hypothetical protein